LTQIADGIQHRPTLHGRITQISANSKSMDERKRQTANPNSISPWRNKKQLADHYGCSIRTIENLMRGRVLPFVKIRRFIRFNVIECDKAMEKYKQRSALL
jgi:hypothetical protein